jgi:Cupin domain
MKELRACGMLLVLLAQGALCFPQEATHVMVSPSDVKWGPASPKLPPGAQFAIVLGDPKVPGAPYVFRAKLPDGYSVPPHWHPMDENVTVISGTFLLGFGERLDKESTRALPAGSFAMLPKNVAHYNVMKGETILQFHGIGPYDIQYVNPADDPTRK